MTIRDLIELLDQYPYDMLVLVLAKGLHIPEVTMYVMDNIPEILVIS